MIDVKNMLWLAEDDAGSIGRIVFFVFIGLMWIIGGLLKKKAEAQARQQAEERAREHQRRMEEYNASSARSGTDGNSAESESPPAMSRVERLQRKHEQIKARIDAWDEELDHARKEMAAALPSQSPPPLPNEQTPPQEKQALRDFVSRQKRSTSLPSAGPSFVTSVKPRMSSPLQTPSAQRLNTSSNANLVGPGNLRQAIVNFEIFSPPKALRDDARLWE